MRHHVRVSVDIEWRDGPSGRRPALVHGPDVWEVIATYRTVGNRVEPTARHLGLDSAQVDAAIAEYRSAPSAVDARIRSETELTERAYADWSAKRAS